MAFFHFIKIRFRKKKKKFLPALVLVGTLSYNLCVRHTMPHHHNLVGGGGGVFYKFSTRAKRYISPGSWEKKCHQGRSFNWATTQPRLIVLQIAGCGQYCNIPVVLSIDTVLRIRIWAGRISNISRIRSGQICTKCRFRIIWIKVSEYFPAFN